jgi:hypothetical protein
MDGKGKEKDIGEEVHEEDRHWGKERCISITVAVAASPLDLALSAIAPPPLGRLSQAHGEMGLSRRV